MKKVITIIIIVILSAVLCCEIVRFVKKDTKGIAKVDPSIYQNNPSSSNEKTIDLHGTYSQNDLVIKREKVKIDGYYDDGNVEYIQISGLKDKKIEEQINKELKDKTLKFANEKIKSTNEAGNKYFNTILTANFANVLSISLIFSTETTRSIQGLNYNLTTGETIDFSDIFKKNEDLTPIVRKILYKGSLYKARALESNEGDPGFVGTPYYDASKETWFCKYSWFDENTGNEKSEIREYVLPMDEHEIEKSIKRFLRNDNKCFYFSPADLTIEIDNEPYSIYLPDIADVVTIYDKYLTESSIFERSDIGIKSLVTCSFENNFGELKETKYESNNLFYDIAFKKLYDDNYPKSDFTNQKDKELQEQLKERINEYKNIAQNNPNKAYFAFLSNTNQNGEFEYDKYNSLLLSNIREKVIVCDIKDRDTLLEQVLNCYRYYNINFYGSIYDFLRPFNSEYDDETSSCIKGFEIKETITEKFYDVITREEYKSAIDIFKDGIDYKSVLNSVVSNNVVKDSTTYSLQRSNLEVSFNKSSNTWVDYSNIRKSIKLKELNADGTAKEDPTYEESNTIYENEVSNTLLSNEVTNEISNTLISNETSNNNSSSVSSSEILPSNTRKIEKSEIQNMTKDELYLAYNEIFARHGQDFQTKKFKDYFSQKEWYQPVEGKVVSLSELNEIEEYNVNLIKNTIDEK